MKFQVDEGAHLGTYMGKEPVILVSDNYPIVVINAKHFLEVLLEATCHKGLRRLYYRELIVATDTAAVYRVATDWGGVQ